MPAPIMIASNCMSSFRRPESRGSPRAGAKRSRGTLFPHASGLSWREGPSAPPRRGDYRALIGLRSGRRVYQLPPPKGEGWGGAIAAGRTGEAVTIETVETYRPTLPRADTSTSAIAALSPSDGDLSPSQRRPPRKRGDLPCCRFFIV